MILYTVVVTARSPKALRLFPLVTRRRTEANKWVYVAECHATSSEAEACRLYDHHKSKGLDAVIMEARVTP